MTSAHKPPTWRGIGIALLLIAVVAAPYADRLTGH